MNFTESCPCHGHLFKADTYFLRSKAKTLKLGCIQCPLAGCRGPELACGEVQSICDALLTNGATEVLLKFCPPLQGPDKELLVSEYERGRRQLMFYLTVKLGCWQQLPLQLVGIAHSNESKAREAAASCLQLFAAYGDRYRHHALSMLLLGADDNAEQFRQFAAGRAREELPLVRRWAARFFLC